MQFIHNTLNMQVSIVGPCGSPTVLNLFMMCFVCTAIVTVTLCTKLGRDPQLATSGVPRQHCRLYLLLLKLMVFAPGCVGNERERARRRIPSPSPSEAPKPLRPITDDASVHRWINAYNVLGERILCWGILQQGNCGN